MIIPVPKIITANKAHGNAGFIHSSYFFCQTPASAKANGTTIEANPKNKVGG